VRLEASGAIVCEMGWLGGSLFVANRQSGFDLVFGVVVEVKV
jgi:hypothetical protein